jgi:hypothetical protein
MTKAAAIHAFFSQFLTAYEENSVYDNDEPPEFPYLTYQLITGAFNPDSNGVSISVSLWYRSELWTAINAKAEEISRTIGRHGVRLKCDDGYILIRRNDSGFAQSMGDPSDDRVKRKLLSMAIEYFTND